MKFIGRIPFWGWFVIITALLYAVWNPPGFSIYGMWAYGGFTDVPPKLFLTAIVGMMIFLVAWGAWIAFKWIGFSFMAVMIIIGLLLLNYLGVFDPTNLTIWAWIIQPIIGFSLAFGLNWGKTRRAVTGVVPTDDTDLNGHLSGDHHT
jgi:hypothetical protein